MKRAFLSVVVAALCMGRVSARKIIDEDDFLDFVGNVNFGMVQGPNETVFLENDLDFTGWKSLPPIGTACTTRSKASLTGRAT